MPWHRKDSFYHFVFAVLNSFSAGDIWCWAHRHPSIVRLVLLRFALDRCGPFKQVKWIPVLFVVPKRSPTSIIWNFWHLANPIEFVLNLYLICPCSWEMIQSHCRQSRISLIASPRKQDVLYLLWWAPNYYRLQFVGIDPADAHTYAITVRDQSSGQL